MPSQPVSVAVGARAPSAKMIGTSARSSNSSIEKAARPTGLAVPATGRISAVDDKASASPSTIAQRSEEHTSELQSLMRNSYAVFCLKKQNSPSYTTNTTLITNTTTTYYNDTHIHHPL